jgi:hypothetical protein
MLELSKLFLNEMKAFFRFTVKREKRKVFRIHSIVGLEILRCVALFKKFAKKTQNAKNAKNVLFTSTCEKIYSEKQSSKKFLFRYIRWRTNLHGNFPSMSPPSSRPEIFASEALFRVTGASLTFSTPFCAAHGGVDGMAGPDAFVACLDLAYR